MMAEKKTLIERDAELIWHPYTQHKTVRTPLPVLKGEGVYLFTEDGTKYIDAISSWWTNVHGHAHPYIAEKIFEQAKQLQHVIFAGCTHAPAVSLAERLLPLLPGNFSKIFFSDNGSTAVEVALKMSIQYWENENKQKGIDAPSRNKILALRNGYHGDTFGAMSISERGVFTLPFKNYLFEVIFIDAEEKDATIDEQCAMLKAGEIACIIYEPVVQGAGGMNMPGIEQMNQLLQFCNSNEIICIADEVMTGFYRTGNFFASEALRVKPDIICLSKGLTGGTLPLALTICTSRIFDAFLSDDKYQTLFHGHSYTANPIACAAALASLDLIQDEKCIANIEMITKSNLSFLQKIIDNKKVLNARAAGTILAFELSAGVNDYMNNIKDIVIEMGLQHGVLIRPLGNTVYIMPPYCITKEELEKVYGVLELVIERG